MKTKKGIVWSQTLLLVLFVIALVIMIIIIGIFRHTMLDTISGFFDIFKFS